MLEPTFHDRYIVTEDDGATARLMWLVDIQPTAYVFYLTAALPYADNMTFDKIVEMRFVTDPILWNDHDDVLPFQVVQIYVDDYEWLPPD